VAIFLYLTTRTSPYNSTITYDFPHNSRMSKTPGFFNDNRSLLLIVLLLTVACLAVYGQVIGFDFITIDDRQYVYENPAVLSGLNARSIYWAFTAFYSSNWHPVTWLSHMLDVTLFGPDAGPMHAVNVVIHTINSILVYLVFRRFTDTTWQSAAVAFLFALHPAHVESVAWIAERKDVLSTTFWLLTMLAYLRYTELLSKTESDGSLLSRSAFWLAVTCVLFAVGLMAKSMLVTLPFVLLLCDYWALERLNKIKDLWPLVKEKLPIFALTVASSIAAYFAQASGGAVVSLKTISFADRLSNAGVAYVKYIAMLFYPAKLGLQYPFDEGPGELAVIGSVALLILITAFCWHFREQHRYLLMGWLWFLGTLVPVIGLVQIGLQGMADRYTYVPYFGLFIMLVWGVADLVKRFKIPQLAVAAAAIALMATLGTLTYVQAGKWKNSETLYEHTLAVTSNNYFLMNNLCYYYVSKRDINVAERRCTELLEAMPPSAEVFKILGELRNETGKFDDALNYYDAALRINPNWAILYIDRSITLSKQGRMDEAEKALLKAKSMNDGSVGRPFAARACFEFAAAVEKKGQTDKARDYYNQAAQLDPNLQEAATNLQRLGGPK